MSDATQVTTGPDPVVFEIADVDTAGSTYTVSGWTVFPETAPSCASVVICFHGGGYTASYFHLVVPGNPGYSMAEHLAGLGHIVVAVDQLGAGASTVPSDGSDVTTDLVAALQHRVALEVVERVSGGTLAAGLAPASAVTTTGVGHSLGGSVLAVQQARYRTFDRVAMCGSTMLPREWGGEFAFRVESGYAHFDRSALRHGFYWEDVPADVVAADEAQGVTMPVGAVNAPDVAAAEVSAIDVPLFVSFGERDVSPSPQGEVGLYTGSSDITLYVVPHSGHCSNFASSRRTLWDRLDAWIQATRR